MPWLVDVEVAPVGETERGHDSPSLVFGRLAQLAAAALEIGDRGLDVVTDEVQLDATPLIRQRLRVPDRMGGELCRS